MKWLAYILLATAALADGPGQRRRDPTAALVYDFRGIVTRSPDQSGFTNSGTLVNAVSVTNDGQRYALRFSSNSFVTASNSVSLALFATNQAPKLVLNNGKYNGFGLLMDTGNGTANYIYRESVTHFGATGRTVRLPYSFATESWSAPVTVFDAVTNDTSGIGGGVIGTNIYVFTSQLHTNTGLKFTVGYLVADTTAYNWSGWNELTLTGLVAMAHFYGPLFTAPLSPTPWHFQTFYTLAGGTNQVGMIASTNNGAAWFQMPTVISSTISQYTETCGAWLGGSNLVLLSRNEDDTYLSRVDSADLGQTWSAPISTGQGGAGGVGEPNIPYLIRHPWGYNVLFLQEVRVAEIVSYSELTVGDLQANRWPFSGKTLENNIIIGYPSAVWTPSNNWLIIYNDEIAATNCTLRSIRIPTCDDGISISGWVRVDPAWTNRSPVTALIGTGDSASANRGYFLFGDNRTASGLTNAIRFSVISPAGTIDSTIIQNTSLFNLGWHYLQADYSYFQRRIRISMDGAVLTNKITTTELGRLASRQLRLGTTQAGTFSYVGQMDSVTILRTGAPPDPTNNYQRALTIR